MRPIKRYLGSILMLAVLGSTVAFAGCAVRMYDRDHDDYHRWNHQENVFYLQWEQDTHRAIGISAIATTGTRRSIGTGATITTITIEGQII